MTIRDPDLASRVSIVDALCAKSSVPNLRCEFHLANNTSFRDASLDTAAIEDDSGTENARTVIVCYNGATTRTSEVNLTFAAICDSLVDAGVVRQCTGDTCYSTLDSFDVDRPRLYEPVFMALDINHDNVLSGDDGAVRLVLLGYSWGGVEAVHVAGMLAADPRVSAQKSVVDLLIVLDPFQVPGEILEVGANVRTFRELRHSVAPPDECSRDAPFGFYHGWTPRCRAQSDCIDYDFSLSPEVGFPTPDGATILGRDVDHCDIPRVSQASVRAMVLREPTPSVPASHPVDVIL